VAGAEHHDLFQNGTVALRILPPPFFRPHESAADATASKVREEVMTPLTMVLFRDGRRDGGDAVAAILRDIVRGRADRYTVKEIDVQDRPGLAVHYNVSTTPTILLMKNGDVVDRVVGTPTRILLDTLLGARTGHARPAVA
jgi:thioredoxin-like negative regulator of GroEL